MHTSQLGDEKISKQIAKVLGELHQIDMPLVKEPIWLFDTMQRLELIYLFFFLNEFIYLLRYLLEMGSVRNKLKTEEEQKVFREIESVFNLSEEVERLK